MNMKRVLLLLLVLGSVSLSAQDSQKRFRHHEFSSSFSIYVLSFSISFVIIIGFVMFPLSISLLSSTLLGPDSST